MMKEWVEISLLIPAESQEGISNFLVEQGTTGIEEVDENPKWKRLKAYFPADGREKKTLRSVDRYLKSLENIYPDLFHSQMEIHGLREQDWSENWKRFFKPIQITRRFLVKPPWSPAPSRKGQIPIVINPGMAFGTGTHATTRLCIQALEKRLARKGATVLDMGTGSGILAILAAKAGAKEVWGIDADQVAVDAARENVRMNGVLDIVKIRKGSIGRIQRRFDIVAANIDFRSLRRMRSPLIRRVKTGGFLILSGVLNRDEETLRHIYLKTRCLKWLKNIREEEWSCLTFRKVGD